MGYNEGDKIWAKHVNTLNVNEKDEGWKIVTVRKYCLFSEGPWVGIDETLNGFTGINMYNDSKSIFFSANNKLMCILYGVDNV